MRPQRKALYPPKPGSNQASELSPKERRRMESLLSFSERKGWIKPRSRGADTGFGILTYRVRAEDGAVQAK
jgi:hypothetical protein